MRPAPSDAGSDPLVREVWESVKHDAAGRAAALDSAVRAYRDTRDERHRMAAVQEAHRLAGSLGSFGYADLSAAAARIEAALAASRPDAARSTEAAHESAQLSAGVAAAARAIRR